MKVIYGTVCIFVAVKLLRKKNIEGQRINRQYIITFVKDLYYKCIKIY